MSCQQSGRLAKCNRGFSSYGLKCEQPWPRVSGRRQLRRTPHLQVSLVFCSSVFTPFDHSWDITRIIIPHPAVIRFALLKSVWRAGAGKLSGFDAGSQPYLFTNTGLHLCIELCFQVFRIIYGYNESIIFNLIAQWHSPVLILPCDNNKPPKTRR